jgi:hypothetical protein
MPAITAVVAHVNVFIGVTELTMESGLVMLVDHTCSIPELKDDASLVQRVVGGEVTYELTGKVALGRPVGKVTWLRSVANA